MNRHCKTWHWVALLALLAGMVDAHAATSVGFLGADSSAALVERLEDVAPGEIRAVSGVAAVRKAQPPIILLVVNAPDGPMHALDEPLRYMSSAGIKRFAIVFTETTKINDPELFGLIVAEVVEKVNAAKLPGSQATVFLDSERVKTDPGLKVQKGLKALAQYLRKS